MLKYDVYWIRRGVIETSRVWSVVVGTVSESNATSVLILIDTKQPE